jgi:CcmD family protein
MDNLYTMLIIQVILWVILFFFIYYLRKKSNETKKELEALKDAWEKKRSGS